MTLFIDCYNQSISKVNWGLQLKRLAR